MPLVIVFDYNGARRFWSGKKWVTEYPDAETYDTVANGVRVFRRVEAHANLRDNEACLVRDYGLANEEPIRWSKAA
jgi:hypothetical protein